MSTYDDYGNYEPSEEKKYRLEDGSMGTMSELVAQHKRQAAEKAEQVPEPEPVKTEKPKKARAEVIPRKTRVYDQSSLVTLGKTDHKYWRGKNVGISEGYPVAAADKYQAQQIYPSKRGKATPAEMAVFMYATNIMGSKDNVLRASMQTLADGAGISLRSAVRAMHSLEDKGWFMMVHKGGGGPKDPNRFVISIPIIDYSTVDSKTLSFYDLLPAVEAAKMGHRDAWVSESAKS